MNANIARTIKKYRQQHGISQAFLGQEIGVSQQAVARWENGSNEPSADQLVKIAQYFGIAVDDILGNITPEIKDIPIAFYEGAKDLNEDNIDKVIDFMQWLKTQQKK